MTTKTAFHRLFPLLLTVLCAATGWAANRFDPKTMMDVHEVQRGARAVGRTVFAGTDISEFRLEVIDVMKQANNGADMILARVLDGPVVARQSGIIGGMSGSPIYINGRLIGAIAWGWGFQKEPITGIMPIRNMLEALDLMDDKAAAAAPARTDYRASRPLQLGGQTFTAARVLAPGQKPAPGVLPLRPVSTPLSCSGVGPRTLDFLRRKLAPYGVEPMAGGGGAAAPVPVDLVPGAAVGVRFMAGDFDMTGIGTVTWRQDDRLLAFGHPLMQLGKVNLPLTSAWINDFMPSFEHSNKLGAGMVDVGVLRADMPWAIAGQLGPKAPLIPANIQIVDKTRNFTRNFQVQAMKEDGLTPLVLASAIASSLEATYSPGFEGMIRTHYELRGENGARITRDNQEYIQGSPAQAALGEVLDLMTTLESNRWQPQAIASLNFRAEVDERDDTVVIEKAYVEENIAKAGKPLRVHVLLRPDGGELRDEVFTLDMPLDLPKGNIRIAVCGGRDTMYFRSRLGLMVPDFDNLPVLLDYIEKLEQNNQLCVMVALPSNGLLVGSTTLMHLPASIAAVFEKSSRTDLSRGKEEMLLTRESKQVVFGRQLLSLATEDRQGAKGAPATSGSTNKPSTETPSKATSDEDAAGGSPRPVGLWWAASALKPAVAERLRREAEAEGRPWPAAETPAKPAKEAAAAKQPAKASEPAKDDDKDDDEEGEDTGKPIVRQPAVWVQEEGSDFVTGELKGAAVGGVGTVFAAPAMTALGKVDELAIWGLLATPKGAYAATSTPGRIYRLGGAKPELFFDARAFGVRALAADAAGNLYAGTWPGGTIYKIAPDGKGSVFASLPCGYIWALAFDAGGKLLAGTGPNGRLYSLDAAGQPTELIQVPQAHILSLLPAADGLYLGTADKGLVYKLLPDRRLLALLDTNGDDVTSLASDAPGRVYAATATTGRVYRLAAEAAPLAIFEDKSTPVYSLAFAGDHLFAATGTEGELVCVSQPDEEELIYDSPMTHVLALATTPEGDLLAATANMSEVLRFSPAAASEATFTSSVLDAKRLARWGAIQCDGSVPPGGALTVQTRSGNSSDPDDGSWSGWSVALAPGGDDAVSSPPARYLQFRATFTKAASTASPVLRRVAVTYLPANQRPEAEFDLEDNRVLRDKADLDWTCSDPDKDQLTAQLHYRQAGTAEWKLIADTAADKKSYEWDTSKLPDGVYDLCLTVSDEPSNPGAGLTRETFAYGVRLDNTKPGLAIQKTAAADGKLTIEGLATDQGRIAEVAYELDKQWRGAIPVDGIFDTQLEQFRLTLALDKTGSAKVQIRVRDTAGNVQTETVQWPLPPAEPPQRDDTKPRPK